MSEQRSFTANGNTSGTVDFSMYRRLPTGEVSPEPISVDFNDYRDPPKGARGRFRLNGWSPFYETQSTFNGETKTVKRVRAEYLIVKLSGHPDFDGTLFSQQFPVPKNIDNEKSKLGQFLSALLNVPTIPKGMTLDLDAFIGTEFVTSITRDDVIDSRGNQHAYCGISWDTIDPTKTKLSPQVSHGNEQPALVGAAVGGEADTEDPFVGEDEEL